MVATNAKFEHPDYVILSSRTASPTRLMLVNEMSFMFVVFVNILSAKVIQIGRNTKGKAIIFFITSTFASFSFVRLSGYQAASAVH